MEYELRILDAITDAEPAGFVEEVAAAISADGSWERFIEVRMGAGPTVRITPQNKAGYAVSVDWGSQGGHLNARTLEYAIECADRLAYAFYKMRDAAMIQD